MNIFDDPFKEISNEHKLTKSLTDRDQLNPLAEFVIHSEILPLHTAGAAVLKKGEDKGVVLPLDFQFRKFFEYGSTLENCLDQMRNFRSCKSELSNYVQGKVWEEKCQLYPDKILVPFFLNIDDFEINNPLGSHAGSQCITAVYYSFPTLENLSELNNIFVAALFNSKDLKNYGNDLVVNTLIDSIISLDVNGVDIKTSNGSIFKVHFVLGLLLGDNLGLNQLLDFSKSFSANMYCRFCRENRISARILAKENIESLRNETNYKSDIEIHDPFVTGLHKNSLLNNIPSFHVTKKLAVDIIME